MFELSGVNYEEVLEQGDSILVRVIASSSYRDYTVWQNVLNNVVCVSAISQRFILLTKMKCIFDFNVMDVRSRY